VGSAGLAIGGPGVAVCAGSGIQRIAVRYGLVDCVEGGFSLNGVGEGNGSSAGSGCGPAVEDVVVRPTDNTIYNLLGQRMPTNELSELPAGIYIVNGKKIIKQ
jgi:hypothetical protein